MAFGIRIPPMHIGIPKVDLFAKSICVDLEQFRFYALFLVHSKTEVSRVLNLCFASFSVVATNKIAVTIAIKLQNLATVVPETSGTDV